MLLKAYLDCLIFAETATLNDYTKPELIKVMILRFMTQDTQ